MKICLECRRVWNDDEVKVYGQKPNSGHDKTIVVIQELCPVCKANVEDADIRKNRAGAVNPLRKDG